MTAVDHDRSISKGDDTQPVPASMDHARRMLKHLADGTTTQRATTARVPISHFSRERWARECDEVFRVVPLALGYTFDLPNPHSYVATTVLDVPVLLSRGGDGVAHAFLNVCQHRGVCLADEGTGQTRRFKCPYHGWTYDSEGALVGLPTESKFGAIERDQYGLIELPCEERHGIIWVKLTPGLPLELDEWLGDLGPVLDSYKLQHAHLHSTEIVAGPNWKAAMDGYLETYHFPVLHPTTRDYFISDMMVFDRYGRHQEEINATPGLAELRDLPESEWPPLDQVLSRALFLFPNVVVGYNFPTPNMPGAQGAAFHVYPGTTFETSTTHLKIFTSRPIETPAQQADVQARIDETSRVITEEDYTMGQRQMRGWQALTHMTYGRNEYLNTVWLHNQLSEILDGAPVDADA